LTDWYEEAFGHCPHNSIRPYCAYCEGNDFAAKQAERKKIAEERKLKEGIQDRDETIARQTAALDDAYRYVSSLERRMREGRPSKRRLHGGR
jgi:hypothetical protein